MKDSIMESEIFEPSDSNNLEKSIEDDEVYTTDDGTSTQLNSETVVESNAHEDGENAKARDDEKQPQEDGIPGENVDSIHSKMPQEFIPTIGMKFETEQDALDFYKRYAYKFGFGIRLSTVHHTPSGFLRDRTFVCSSQGKRGKDKRNVYVKNHRAETRFGCGAKMKIRYDSSSTKYVVSAFLANHTHMASTPSKTHRFRSHRKISLVQNVVADMADDSGLDPKETLDLLSRQAGGREYLGFVVEDYRNYLRSKRTREMKQGDTGGVLEYLQKMQSDDPNFTYAIQVDVDDLVTNIFWADAKMKVDYDYFGDVVCFDTTYRKNKEGRPFAMFVGVNNHKQTLIFGAALLYDETTETFMWLFDTFANTMSGKRPISMLTDQDAAMAKALSIKWPETHHRLCIWHIYQNAAKHLKSVFEQFKNFAKDFSSIIYDYEDVEDFLIAWQNMLEKYNLQENTWLSRLFDLKEKWALVYGRQVFCADITTTQRSESMNNAIKRYVSYKYDLLRFFRHFQRLVDDRRYKELVADFKANHTSPALSFPVKILKNAAKVYTPVVYKWFQAELCKAHDCTTKLFSDIGTMRVYDVTAHGNRFSHMVTFDSVDSQIICSCKKFEFAGILCSHALKVLAVNDVKAIPSQYISKRWRKDIRDQMPKVPCPDTIEEDPKAKVVLRYRDLARLHTELVTISAVSDEAYEIASKALHKALVDVKTSLRTSKKAPEDTLSINNGSHEVVADEFDEHRVKGIKVKERIARKEDSIRPKNALEKLVRNKRPRQDVDTPSRHQKEPELNSVRVHGSENQFNEKQSTILFGNNSHTVNANAGVVLPPKLPVNPVSSYGLPQQPHLVQHPQYTINTGKQPLQFNSFIWPPEMQFMPPYQFIQNIEGSNVRTPYQQDSITYFQHPLATNWNNDPSISLSHTGTSLAEEQPLKGKAS